MVACGCVVLVRVGSPVAPCFLFLMRCPSTPAGMSGRSGPTQTRYFQWCGNSRSHSRDFFCYRRHVLTFCSNVPILSSKNSPRARYVEHLFRLAARPPKHVFSRVRQAPGHRSRGVRRVARLEQSISVTARCGAHGASSARRDAAPGMAPCCRRGRGHPPGSRGRGGRSRHLRRARGPAVLGLRGTAVRRRAGEVCGLDAGKLRPEDPPQGCKVGAHPFPH